ncbi:MAG: hypothetical protein ACI9T7_003326 [Oleiphilaceae bacterium]|jgi:hypothetical protein
MGSAGRVKSLIFGNEKYKFKGQELKKHPSVSLLQTFVNRLMGV